ncbi:hypothetical protein BT96DRAFT_916167, partial [Gymnopus androsaceus JB14]
MALSSLRVTIDNASIHTKLRSGYGTCPSESSEIFQILQLAEKDLEDYETELHELQMRILSIKFQKKRLEDYMKKLRSLRAPIRKLPNELFLRIFLFCCGDNDGRFGVPNVIVIGAVCTRWRELVNSCSQIWTRFAVDFCSIDDFDFEDPNQNAATSQIKLYMERSRDQLLSMYISAGYWEEKPEHPGFHLLLAQSHRWRNLSFRGNFSPDSHPGLFANPSIAFPALETVEIDMSDYDGDEAFPAELGLFQHAPRLHALSLFGYVDVATQGFPWGQITTLELDTGLLNVYPVIAVCPNLQVIGLRADFDIGYETPDDPLTSKHVVSFSITGTFTRHNSDTIEAILSSFTFPSLRSLELAHTNRTNIPPYPYWPKGELQKLLSRSRCSVTLLSLRGLSLSGEDAVNLLQQVPSLQDLLIHDALLAKPTCLPVTTVLIENLHGIHPSNLQPLVPSLKNLSLIVKDGDKLDVSAFVETIASRWLPNPEYAASIGVSCLRSVELVIHNRKENLDLFSPLDHLEKAGMRVFIAKCRETRCALCQSPPSQNPTPNSNPNPPLPPMGMRPMTASGAPMNGFQGGMGQMNMGGPPPMASNGPPHSMNSMSPPMPGMPGQSGMMTTPQMQPINLPQQPDGPAHYRNSLATFHRGQLHTGGVASPSNPGAPGLNHQPGPPSLNPTFNSNPNPNLPLPPPSMNHSASSMLGGNPGPPHMAGMMISGTTPDLPLFSADFMNDIGGALDTFDPSIFRDSGDLNFERDFGQWFNPNDQALDGSLDPM